MKPAASRQVRSGSRARRLGLVAAVIFVALLVGSFAVLLQRGHPLVSGRPTEEEMFALVNRTLYRLVLRASDGKQIGSFKVNEKVDPNNRVLLQVVE